MLQQGGETMAKQQLTATVNVISGNTAKAIECLTADERKTMLAEMQKRLSQSMSLYYTQHTDELRKVHI